MDRSDMMHRMYDIKGPLVAKKLLKMMKWQNLSQIY